MKDIYEKLRERLDDLATGYPATESRVEIRIPRSVWVAGKKSSLRYRNPSLP